MKKSLLILVFALVTMVSQGQQKKWTLEECVAYALENNISVKQSELDVKVSEIRKKDAIGNFLPSLNASTSYGWNIGLSQDPVTFNAVTATSKTLSGGVSSGVTLYNGLRNLNQLYRSNLEIISKQYQLDKMKDDISLLVANSFLQILFNKESLKVLESQQSITQQQLKRTQDLVDAGSLPKGDLLEVQATIASQEQQIVNAENAIQLSKISLAQILLIEDYQNFDTADSNYITPEPQILNQSVNAIVAKAKEVRYDIKIAETNSELAQYDLKIAKGAYQPTLSGFYSFGTNYFTSELFETPNFKTQVSDNKGHSFGVQLSIPIFNGWAASNNVDRSKVNVERSRFQLEQANLDLETAVYQAYNDVRGALKAYQASEKTLAARQEAFNYSRERYNVGLLNAFDFNQSQNQFESAQSEVLRAKYDYTFKLKVLEFYFGIPITNLN